MSGSMSHAASAEPNLTPMLDMVFQLVTFFMLVCNFKAASMDLSLKLPVVGSARPVDTKGQNSLIVLNINSKGDVNIQGRTVKGTDIGNYMAGEAQVDLIKLRDKNPEIKLGDDLPSIVVIRADRSTRFALLNRVIQACQANGYRNFAMKAMNKEAEEKKG